MLLKRREDDRPGRYREAGEVLLGSLQVRPGQVGQLEPSLKKRALSAAIWLAKGGEAQVSVELFVALVQAYVFTMLSALFIGMTQHAH